ncbi:MAG: polyphosphate polymerase domain-containing protein [Erysipelotrichaceae bacterium]|nr:polyphosphate polymerase domain-containing protein [Erysipelotrichaceae bacterium]
MKYRTEWKYICTDYDLDLLYHRLKAVLHTDMNANKELYNIHSLYFDDYHNSCAFDNDAGADRRRKWRIRYYDDDLNFIKLERKSKRNDLCYKESCPISLQELNCLVKGEVSELFWNSKEKLLKEFCVDIMTKRFVPKVIIDYERTAFVDPILNVRLTFDKNISASVETEGFTDMDYLKYPIQEKGNHVLEVKFDDLLPGYLEKLIHESGLQRNTFSKYYLGRLVLERNLI